MNTLQENFRLQLESAILFFQRIMKHFTSQGQGNFIRMFSIQGVASPKFQHYDRSKMISSIENSAVKSRIIAMTHLLEKYYIHTNIPLNCLILGLILDQQFESFLEKYRASCTSRGMLDPTFVTGRALFLLSDQSKFIKGQNIVVNDGGTI